MTYNIPDQFDIASSSEYSGSITDNVIFGDVGVESFTASGDKRMVMTGKVARSPSAYLDQAYLPYWVIEGYASGSYLGRPQRFSRVISESETYYDSLVPNPIEIHLNSGMGLGWNSIDLNASFPKWGVRSIAGTGSLGGGSIAHTWSLFGEQSWSGGWENIVDTKWIKKWPFESSYKGIPRLSNFSGIFDTEYTSNFEVIGGGNTFTPASSSNVLGTGFGVSVTGFAGFIAGYMAIPGVEYPAVLSADTTFGSIPKKMYFDSFFGFGDGWKGFEHIISRNSIFFTKKEGDIAVILLRGYKYGLYSAQPTKTSCMFRYNKYGQFRDMLEQRPFSKFSDDSLGETTTNGVVRVSFVTGSQAYANSIDYVSATNPDYDPTDTGFYDYEYRAGQPFYDG